MRHLLDSKLFRFALVGGVGFIADALVFTLCLKWLALPMLQARLVAFICAATVTWVGNRCFTFSNYSRKRYVQRRLLLVVEWGKFMLSASVSAIPNFITFKLILTLFGNDGAIPYLALVLGILLGMVSNFILSSRWVFHSHQ